MIGGDDRSRGQATPAGEDQCMAGLPEAITAVRAELPAPIEQGADAGLRFPVESVGCEFQVTMTVEGRRGEARLWVVEWAPPLAAPGVDARGYGELGASVNQAG